MDEGSDSRPWAALLKRLFQRKGESHLEDAIQEAKDGGELQTKCPCF